MKRLFFMFASVFTMIATAFATQLPVLAAQAPKGPLPFTGDHTPFALIGIIMAVALVIIVVLIVSMRKKK